MKIQLFNSLYNFNYSLLTIDEKISYKEVYLKQTFEHKKAYSENMNKQRWQALNFLDKQLYFYTHLMSFKNATLKASLKKIELETKESIKFSKACKKDTTNMTIKELEIYKKEIHSFLLKRLNLADNTEIIEIKKELSLIEKMIKKVDSKVFSVRAKQRSFFVNQ